MIYPHDIVTEGSRQLLARGVTILEGNRFADTEEAHIARLAGYMQLNGEKEVADMGCGFGAVSWLLSKQLPQIHFWLVNQNRFQLRHCPLGRNFARRLEDMCATSIPAGSVDLVMFNYSLCHVDPRAALAEAARIAHPDRGKLFVYDYERVSGDDALTEKHLFAQFKTDKEFRDTCAATGWRNVQTIHPGGDDTLFRQAVNNDALYDAMFDHLRPVIWRAHR